MCEKTKVILNLDVLFQEIQTYFHNKLCDNLWDCLWTVYQEKYYDYFTEEELAKILKTDKVFIEKLEQDAKNLNLVHKTKHNLKWINLF